MSSSSQHVSLSVVWNLQQIFISNVYASTNYVCRRQLWHELFSIQAANLGPWCHIGDFNAVLGAHEVRGSHLPLRVSYEEFKAWTDASSLTHLATRRAEFTWNNGRRCMARIERRLDRAICNDSWLSFWDSSTCCALPKSQSDHHPLLMIMKKGPSTGPCPFKFLAMWADHPDCSRLVSAVWKRPCVGCPLSILS